MKHLAAFESGKLGSRHCCGWQHVALCESVHMPMMPNWFHTYRARCPAEDQPLPLQPVSDQKFESAQHCMIDRRSCQRSWAVATRIMEAVWAMIQVPFQVWDPALLGIFGTRCGERKRMSLIEVGSRDQFGFWLFFGGLRFWCFQLLVFGVVFLCFGLGRALLFHSFCSLTNHWVPRPRQFSKMFLIVHLFCFSS